MIKNLINLISSSNDSAENDNDYYKQAKTRNNDSIGKFNNNDHEYKNRPNRPNDNYGISSYDYSNDHEYKNRPIRPEYYNSSNYDSNGYYRPNKPNRPNNYYHSSSLGSSSDYNRNNRNVKEVESGGMKYKIYQGEALVTKRFNDPSFGGYAPSAGIGPVLNPLNFNTDTRHLPIGASIPTPIITKQPVNPFTNVETLPIVNPGVGMALIPGPPIINAGPSSTIVNQNLHNGTRTITSINRPGWVPIGVWSPCTKPCGVGVQRRSLKCMRPMDCEGNDFQEQNCNIQECKHDLEKHMENLKKVAEGKWEYLGTWTVCSEPCGPGFQSINRRCLSNLPCSGPSLIKQSCNMGPCNSSMMKKQRIFDMNNYPECQPTTLQMKIKSLMGSYEAKIIVSMENIQIYKGENQPYMTLPLSHILTFQRSTLEPGCVDVTKDNQEEIWFCPQSKIFYIV